jgi:hypothetical protein
MKRDVHKPSSMVFDKACITIAAAYQQAKLANGALPAQSALQGSAIPSSQGGDSQHISRAADMVEKTEGAYERTSFLFTSKEASMAAVCREVAVKGFDPMPNVFGRKEW